MVGHFPRNQGKGRESTRGQRRQEKREETENNTSTKPRKDKSPNKMKSSSRPKLAEKHVVSPLNTESCLGTLWKWVELYFWRDKK